MVTGKYFSGCQFIIKVELNWSGHVLMICDNGKLATAEAPILASYLLTYGLMMTNDEDGGKFLSNDKDGRKFYVLCQKTKWSDMGRIHLTNPTCLGSRHSIIVVLRQRRGNRLQSLSQICDR